MNEITVLDFMSKTNRVKYTNALLNELIQDIQDYKVDECNGKFTSKTMGETVDLPGLCNWDKLGACRKVLGKSFADKQIRLAWGSWNK